MRNVPEKAHHMQGIAQSRGTVHQEKDGRGGGDNGSTTLPWLRLLDQQYFDDWLSQAMPVCTACTRGAVQTPIRYYYHVNSMHK